MGAPPGAELGSTLFHQGGWGTSQPKCLHESLRTLCGVLVERRGGWLAEEEKERQGETVARSRSPPSLWDCAESPGGKPETKGKRRFPGGTFVSCRAQAAELQSPGHEV